MYHYTPGTPYTATIGGTSTSSYLNPNSFLLGDNQPGGELSGITKTPATDGYFRYSLTALATNSFTGPLGWLSSKYALWNGRTQCEFLWPHDPVLWGLRDRER